MELQLNTSQIPADDRVDLWRSAMQAALRAELLVEPKCSQSFEASVGVMGCGEAVKVIDLAGAAYRSTRSDRGDGSWVSVMFQIEGNAVLSDHRRTAQLRPGDACVVPPDRAIVAERGSRFRQIIVNLRRGELDEAAPVWQDLTTRTIERSCPRVRPASDLLRLMVAHHDLLGAACREQMSAALVGLVGRMIRSPDGAMSPSTGSAGSRMAAFHRQRIERFIQDNLRDPDLSVSMIAGELGLSMRYIHKLFEHEDHNVMQWAQAQRMARCRRDIATRGARSISEVAYGWGFNSPAHFSRAFKKHFGLSPSQA